jgi:hypothetical protein
MNQTLKFVLVTAAGFALGYTLYGMLKQNGAATAAQKANGGANGAAAAKPAPSPDAIGNAVAGVLID